MPIGFKFNGLVLCDAQTVSSTSKEEDITRSHREASSGDLASRSSTIGSPQQQHYDSAEADLAKAPLPPFYLAMSKEAMGDAPGALPLYEEAEVLSPEKTPQTAAILVAHGRLLYSLGKFEESIAKDQLAIEADNQSRDAFYERAKGLEHQGKYEAAAADGERALTLPELGTSDSQVHFLLGNVYLRLNKPDLAAAHLAKFRAAPQTTQR